MFNVNNYTPANLQLDTFLQRHVLEVSYRDKAAQKLALAILSNFSIKDLGRLALVCQVANLAVNDESIWEKLCQQEDPQGCQIKPALQLWKNFYKNVVDLANYERKGALNVFRLPGQKDWVPLTVNSKANIIHVKRLLNRKYPHLPVKDMVIFIGGVQTKDEDNFLNYEADWRSPSHVIIKNANAKILRKSADEKSDQEIQKLALVVSSIADPALCNKGISSQLKTLQYLNTSIPEISIPQDLPLKMVVEDHPIRIEPFPLLQLSEKLHPLIFSNLSVKELGRLALVCKVINAAANNENLWQKLCEQEDPQDAQKKPDVQLWKDFCKHDMDLPPIDDDQKVTICVKMTGNYKGIVVAFNATDTIRQMKRRIHKSNPSLPTEKINIFIRGDLTKDSDIFSTYEPWNLNCILARIKTPLQPKT